MYLKSICYSIIFCFGFSYVLGQSSTSFQKKIYEQDSLGVVAFQEADYQRAIQYFQQSLKNAKLSKIDTLIALCSNNLAVVYENVGEIEKAKVLQKDALSIWNKSFGPQHPYYTNSLNNLSYLYETEGDYEAAERLQIEAVDLARRSAKEYPALYANTLSNLAYIYEAIGRYDEALSLQKEALEIRIQEKIEADLAISYNNIGAIYDHYGRYNEALNFYEQSKEQNLKSLGAQHPDYARNLNNIAKTQMQLGKLDDARALFKKALEIQEISLGKEHHDYTSSLANLATTYLKLDQTDKAIELLDESRLLIEKEVGKEHPDYAISLRELAELYLSKKDYTKTRMLLEQSLQTFEQAFEQNHPQIIKNILLKGDLAKDQGKWELADSFYLGSLKINSFRPQDFNLTDIQQQFYSNTLALKSIKALYQLHWKVYQNNKSQLALEKTYAALNAAVKLSEQVRNSFNQDEEKLRILKEVSQLLEASIAVELLFAKELNENPVEATFQFAELNKSILLMDAIKASEAKNLSNLPKDIWQEEVSLQKQLKELEKQAVLSSSTDKNKLIEEQNKLSLKIDAFQQDLKDQYPNYYKLKYQSEKIAIEDIQKTIAAGSYLLEYFIGDSTTYLFVLGAEIKKVIPISVKKKMLNRKVNTFRRSLSDYTFIKDKPEQAAKEFTQNAYWLYQQLLADLFKEVGDAKELIIVADGSLGHIPFETLLKEETSGSDYSTMPYLLNDYKISYNYSARLWLENLRQPRREHNKQLLAYAANYAKIDEKALTRTTRAPHLRNLRDALTDLPEVRKEVEALSQFFDGTILLDDTANEHSFKANAKDYGIIHLAMHGILNSQYPILSSLAFSENQDSLEDNFLHAHEIAQMELTAELVVLSACETGFGKFQQGEGVMSLARSFMYAGVPSLVVSLWQVNDASTSLIMQDFYRNLAKGMDKAEALQKAKLSYIASSNAMSAHPAFWAAFIQLGDARAIETHQPTNYLKWTLIGVGAFLLIGFIAFRFRSKKD